ncbi:integrase core domain-containing protein [Mycolicibacterium pyrenivorans]|uniref:integrase core domain-containing protein n=1 Tax=Mycolicibacterium pyrenivorans TaxID=187102 RepID=UPI0021F3B5B0|nr:integrase core domain-containing protein [Mycolicibacterium pyrenivorans]
MGRSRTNSSVGKAPGVTYQVELTTAEWVVWFNTERPHEYLADFTPEAAETLYHDHRTTPPRAG